MKYYFHQASITYFFLVLNIGRILLGLYFELVDFDKEFHNSSKIPTILNDLEENSEKDKEYINSCIYTRYTSDLLSNIPACGCNNLIGQDLLGVTCPECHDTVKDSIETDLEPLIWIRAPEGVPSLINPIAWIIISKRYTKSGFNVLRYLCDVSYNPSLRKPDVLNEIKSLGIPRSFINFVTNFDKIIETLNGLTTFRLKRGEIDYVQDFIKYFRKILFVKYVPIINKSILVFEDENQGNFVDSSVPGIVNAARIMVGIDVPGAFSLKQKENRAIKAIVHLAEVYERMNDDAFLSGKPGLLRKHVFGNRSYFSFRAVVSSITNAHHYREIHIPWGIATSVFSIHIKNKLLRQGMTSNEATAFVHEHAQKYSPEMDRIFNELIYDSIYPNTPYKNVVTKEMDVLKGVPVTMARNPSLNVNSIQLCYVTKVKTDIDDPTVSIPMLSILPMNADFDGKKHCRH